MKRITGTHVYTYLRCPRAVALDMHGDPHRRRAATAWEELVLRRGREVEADHVAGLSGYVEPAYPRRDHGAGAEATAALMRQGVEGICQGVLLRGDCLGIPDLLRRVPGESELGRHHFEVLDVKSSHQSRSDQLLQVAFYSRLLAEEQGRAPEFGYLVLKDGREERFSLAEFAPALEEVEGELRQILADPDRQRPFLNHACSRCRWSELCGEELIQGDDLSLVQGMTRGLRTLLERNGAETCSGLRDMSVDAVVRRTHIPVTQLRRLKRAAQARAAGKPLVDKGLKKVEASAEEGRGDPPASALVHFLTDHFERRVLFMGLLYPSHPDGSVRMATPGSRAEEWPAFCGLIRDLPSNLALAHYGNTVLTWYEEWDPGGERGLRGRFVDLARRLRGAAVYPGPVFGLEDHIKWGLGKDPHREGHAAAAPLWAGTPEGGAWLEHKGCSDLRDLARLKVEILGGDGGRGTVS